MVKLNIPTNEIKESAYFQPLSDTVGKLVQVLPCDRIIHAVQQGIFKN